MLDMKDFLNSENECVIMFGLVFWFIKAINVYFWTAKFL